MDWSISHHIDIVHISSNILWLNSEHGYSESKQEQTALVTSSRSAHVGKENQSKEPAQIEAQRAKVQVWRRQCSQSVWRNVAYTDMYRLHR